MHDIKYIRDNEEAFTESMQRRGQPHLIKKLIKTIIKFDTNRRTTTALVENEREMANVESKRAGIAKSAGHEKEFKKIRDIVTQRKKKIAGYEKQTKELDIRFNDVLLSLPNNPLDDVPIGENEEDNDELHDWGNIPSFKFTPKEHFNIPSVALCTSFEYGAKISGSRFVFLAASVARVHRALGQFMLDIHINEHELLEVNVPVIVNEKALEGTGQLPKFKEDCYKISNDNSDVENAVDQWLIPTSEVPLTNIVADRILNKNQLPQRFCAHSLCFRQEAGSAGRDTKGILRMHQFEKVEMVSITHPNESRKELDIMTERAEAVLKKLDLAFRTVVLCTGDMGFSAQRTHDIEVWLPGQKRYREISSVSLCGDFQARRMNARFREKDGDKPQFVHTLNGSGVAVGRCLIAVLENGQQEDGSVKLPKVLHRYLGENDHIDPNGDLQKTIGK